MMKGGEIFVYRYKGLSDRADLTKAGGRERADREAGALRRSHHAGLSRPFGCGDTDLRRRLGDSDAEFHVVKNTLLRIAADANRQDFGGLLEGPSAITILYGDPVGVAKVFSDFLREHRNVTLKGGVLDGRPLSAAQVGISRKSRPRRSCFLSCLPGIRDRSPGSSGRSPGFCPASSLRSRPSPIKRARRLNLKLASVK